MVNQEYKIIDKNIEDLIFEYQLINGQIKNLEKEKEILKAKLKKELKNCDQIFSNNHIVKNIWKDKTTFDRESFDNDYPGVYDVYASTKKISSGFSIKKKPDMNSDPF